MNTIDLAALALFFLAQSTPPAAAPSTPPSVPTPDDARQRMDLAEKTNGLHGFDTPYHLKATFQVFGPDGKPADTGTYEEWRISDQQFRAILHSPSLAVEEFGSGSGISYSGQWPGLPLGDLTRLIARPVPVVPPEKIALENFQKSFGAQKLPCTALLLRDKKETRSNAPFLCFAPENGVLLYTSGLNSAFQTLFKETGSVRGHFFARSIEQYIAGRQWLKVHIDTFEGLNKGSSDPFIVPADASPAPLFDFFATMAEGNLVKKAVPVYPETAKLQGLQGTVIVDAVIGKDGRPGRLEPIEGPEMLYKPSIEAVRQWTYTPFLVNGKPVEVELLINVVYALRR